MSTVYEETPAEGWNRAMLETLIDTNPCGIDPSTETKPEICQLQVPPDIAKSIEEKTKKRRNWITIGYEDWRKAWLSRETNEILYDYWSRLQSEMSTVFEIQLVLDVNLKGITLTNWKRQYRLVSWAHMQEVFPEIQILDDSYW